MSSLLNSFPSVTSSHHIEQIRIEWMATAKLRLLRIIAFQLLSNAVEKLYVRLLGVSLKGGNKCPGHGARGLASNVGILSALCIN